MTAKEERHIQDKIKAVQDTMFVIGGKWKMSILVAIYHGNKRFNDISTAVPKITSRVLSKELKHLEENLLIKRTIVSDYPIKIEYTPTDYFLSITEIIRPMENWGKNHRKKLMGKK